jgi:1-acyl-sn-glycerol-3-phosphate acyltransferase
VTTEDAHRFAGEAVSRVSGAESIPAAGARIIAADHKSFLDPFLIGIRIPGHLRFMAKTAVRDHRHGAALLRPLAKPRRVRAVRRPV